MYFPITISKRLNFNNIPRSIYKFLFHCCWPHWNVKHGRCVCFASSLWSWKFLIQRNILKNCIFFPLKNGYQKNQRLKVLVIPLLPLTTIFYFELCCLKLNAYFESQNFRQGPSQQNEGASFSMRAQVILLNQ